MRRNSQMLVFLHIQIYLSQYRLLLLGSSFPHCGQNVAELFPLSLSADVSSHPFLDEFEGTLVPGHFQQLHSTPLIGGETTHLADHVTHKLSVFGQTPSPAAVLGLGNIFGYWMAFIKANCHRIPDGHLCEEKPC